MTAYLVGAGLLAVGSAGYGFRDKLQSVSPAWLIEFAPIIGSQIDVGSLTEAATNYLPGWLYNSGNTIA